MRAAIIGVLALALLVASPSGADARRKTLDIYVVDVEGGNATLFVSPSGESLLMDTGNGGAAAARDADRIMAAVKDAGLTQIDHLITTHWHGDHFGAMAELAGRIPIRHYIDHGPSVQSQPASDVFLKDTYPGVVWQGEAHDRETRRSHSHRRSRLAHRHIGGRGDQDAAARCRQAEPAIAPHIKPQDVDPTENAQSVGSVITFGELQGRAPRRSHVEQGIRPDVSDQPHRHRRCVFRLASRPAGVERRSAGARAAVARRDHEQRHAQGRSTAGDADHPLGAAPRRPVAGAFFDVERPGTHRARACSSRTPIDDQPDAMPVAPMAPPQPGPGAPRRRCTTARPTGSRCRRSRMARSPSRTPATASARLYKGR